MSLIHAIKALREETGWDLRRSKEVARRLDEALATGEQVEAPTADRPTRDEVAMAAMVGLLAQTDRAVSAAEISRQAYVVADAMMAQRVAP